MAYMPASKNWLFVGLLSVMGSALAAPFQPGVALRFGEWTLARANTATEVIALAPPLYRVNPSPGRDEEIFLYFGDGEQRALLLRFSADPKEDRAVLMTGLFSQRLNGCRQGLPARLSPLKTVLGSKQALKAERAELSDDTVLRIGDGERGLRRVGDELVADLGGFRVRILADGANVHIGEPGSGQFCRFELAPATPE